MVDRRYLSGYVMGFLAGLGVGMMAVFFAFHFLLSGLSV